MRAAARSAQVNTRQAQLKWYLHWRRWQVSEQNDSVIQFHRDFLDVTFGIHKGEVALPPKFTKEWFSRALGLRDGGIEKVLPENIKRSKKNKASLGLLASPSNDEPKIPPIGRHNFTFF